jgi:hypothetical protein|tara:strand:+ start:81 stop:365 length:285 start_codon:yes stop_codon:yes gene_type:complete
MTEYVRVIERVELLNSYVLKVPSAMSRDEFVDWLASNGMAEVADESVERTVYENDVAESYIIEINEHLPEKMKEEGKWQLYETDGEGLYEHDNR